MLDAVDRKIIGLLQRDARISNADISRAVGMVPSATLERVRKLEEKGILKGYHAAVDPGAMGMGLLAFVFVKTTEGWTTRETAHALAAIPHVLECHDVAGDDCYLLKVRAGDAGHLNRILREHLGRMETVVSTKTTIVFETYKEVPAVLIEEVDNA